MFCSDAWDGLSCNYMGAVVYWIKLLNKETLVYRNDYQTADHDKTTHSVWIFIFILLACSVLCMQFPKRKWTSLWTCLKILNANDVLYLMLSDSDALKISLYLSHNGDISSVAAKSYKTESNTRCTQCTDNEVVKWKYIQITNIVCKTI